MLDKNELDLLLDRLNDRLRLAMRGAPRGFLAVDALPLP